MIFSLVCLFGFLALICTPGLIAHAREERSAASAAGTE